MANAITLATLRSKAREYADQETSSPTTAFVDNTELDARINEAARRLYNKLILARGHEHYIQPHSWPTEVDEEYYALPVDFMKAQAVYVDDGSRYTQVKSWEMTERPDLLWRGSVGSTNLHEYCYRIQGQNLSLLPKPSTTGHTLRMLYVPTMPELEADTDEFDDVNGWGRWIALTVAVDMARKEESFELVQALKADIALIEDEIETLAGERAADPPRIQDTRRDLDEMAPWHSPYWEGWL